MDFGKMFQKGGLAILTFIVAYLASHPQLITNLVPKELTEMTVGGLIAAALVALANWMKHRND